MNQILLSVIAEGGPGNTGPDFGKASPVGLLVIVLLVIATLFLVRSMNQQLKKVPKSFDRDHPELDQAADEGTGGKRKKRGKEKKKKERRREKRGKEG